MLFGVSSRRANTQNLRPADSLFPLRWLGRYIGGPCGCLLRHQGPFGYGLRRAFLCIPTPKGLVSFRPFISYGRQTPVFAPNARAPFWMRYPAASVGIFEFELIATPMFFFLGHGRISQPPDPLRADNMGARGAFVRGTCRAVASRAPLPICGKWHPPTRPSFGLSSPFRL